MKLNNSNNTDHQALKCPRCESTNTKFCYYNNYSLSQPRHFCKGCRRYWTHGGSLRNVPVGGGSRKNKRPSSSFSSSSSSTSSKRSAPDHLCFHSSNANHLIPTLAYKPSDYFLLTSDPNPNPNMDRHYPENICFLDQLQSGSSDPVAFHQDPCYGFDVEGGGLGIFNHLQPFETTFTASSSPTTMPLRQASFKAIEGRNSKAGHLWNFPGDAIGSLSAMDAGREFWRGGNGGGLINGSIL